MFCTLLVEDSHRFRAATKAKVAKLTDAAIAKLQEEVEAKTVRQVAQGASVDLGGKAARVDGASNRSIFFQITLPLLRPTLAPAVMLGIVWTFNMFNIIYLVSGGEPAGSTDILITEAYRWAFIRHERYGLAAAYATLIFVILIGYTLITNRITRATESAYR